MCIICASAGEDPEAIDVGMKWVRGWLMEHRLASRMPNRKYKVARWVLSERMCIYWLNIHKLRCWIILEFGYDPDCRNVDQMPLHRNEAGSKCYGTIVLKNQDTVPLIENHASTRERYSLSTVTDSNEDRINSELPGFEIMFKAEGKQKEQSFRHMQLA